MENREILIRKIIRNSWNNSYATGTVNGHNRVIGEFRAINNAGDFLSRKNYVCGLNLHCVQNCDSTHVPSSSANPKFVTDSSDYTKYRKQRAYNKNFK